MEQSQDQAELPTQICSPLITQNGTLEDDFDSLNVFFNDVTSPPKKYTRSMKR